MVDISVEVAMQQNLSSFADLSFLVIFSNSLYS